MSINVALYADAASGEPPTAVVREAFLAALDAGWADPRRLYRDARRARQVWDAARASVAASLRVRPDAVHFTGSGSAALHAAASGALRALEAERIVTSAVEHSALLRFADFASEHSGVSVTSVGVDGHGRVDVAGFAAAAGSNERCVAFLQSANHEVGTVQPVNEVHEQLRRGRCTLLVDAAAQIGRLPLPDGGDLIVGSARKWGGMPGVGVLAVRRRESWRPPGPADDMNPASPGFPNIPAIAASALALELALATSAEESARLHALTEWLRSAIAARIPDATVLGHPEDRLPHLVSAVFLYVDAEALVQDLDMRGFAVGSGSACTSDIRRPSHILTAMGALTHGNVRIGLRRGTTQAEVEALLEALVAAVARNRSDLGVDGI